MVFDRGVFLPPFVRKSATPSRRNPSLCGGRSFSRERWQKDAPVQGPKLGHLRRLLQDASVLGLRDKSPAAERGLRYEHGALAINLGRTLWQSFESRGGFGVWKWYLGSGLNFLYVLRFTTYGQTLRLESEFSFPVQEPLSECS